MPSLTKITPLDPPVIVPLGDDGKPAVQVMLTPNGLPVYRVHRIRAGKHVPRLGPDGEQVVVKNENTGVPMYKKWNREVRQWDQLITVQSDGHGTLYMEDYQEPSPEEMVRAETDRKAAAFKDDLARLAAERGLSAEAVIARLMDEADEQPEDRGTYPIKAPGVGRWFLSDGSKMQGSQADAEAAEAALHAAA